LVREDPIELSEAPAYFFADDWARLMSLKGGKAGEAVDSPDPDGIVWVRGEFLKSDHITPEVRARAMAEEEVYAIVNRLHDGMRALGSDRRITAVGLYLGTGLRQAIPTELWATAKVAFADGTVASRGFVYHSVAVELPAASVDVESIAAAMSAWLDGRRAEHGDETKKALLGAAREKFGETFRVRIFNAAYADCYGRIVGRPTKRKK
jgi:hypothetical protein